MTTAVVADAHIGGPGGPAGPLIEQLVALPAQGCERLVLLGDLFQVWVGYPAFTTPEIEAVAAALAELRGTGVEVDYVEGNRDFYLRGGRWAETFDRLALEMAFVAGGRRFLAVHGDGLDEGDVQYRLWRRLSKSLPVRLLVRSLPRRLARRFVYSTERQLASTNFKHKVRIPRDAILRYGEQRLAEGHDVLLLGHFHEAHCWPVSGGEVWLLDAWFRSRCVEWPGRGSPCA
ncbi:MAG TPA: UDP-2,3-diacylglucosamine diphosphatase [Thermoanaerobaculia bacterium]|nr:UDP-2,3-diacylglucosamine diphosphatase [Thermoanaerobaculia bacterium]